MTTTRKTPQDRKPPAKKTTSPEVDGFDPAKHLAHEVDGVTYLIDKGALDDFELLDQISRLESGEAQCLPGVLRKMLASPAEFAKAMDSVRDPATGRVSIEAGGELVSKMLDVDPNS